MSIINIKAHDDGEQILLDEPAELPVNAQLQITVLSVPDDIEHAATTSLARAYSDNEPEYSSTALRP